MLISILLEGLGDVPGWLVVVYRSVEVGRDEAREEGRQIAQDETSERAIVSKQWI